MIAVHAGAGYHSPTLEAAYKRDLAEACRAGAAALAGGGDALAAVTSAIKVLEASSHCNAGRGSNLSFNGLVECDASVMAGDGTFGSVAAAPGIEHPVEAAALLARESRQPLPYGRVRPLMLAGDRAREWAVSRGLPAGATPTEAGAMHLTDHTQRQWRKYRRIVDGGGSGGAAENGGGGAAGGAAERASGGGGTPSPPLQPPAVAQQQQQQGLQRHSPSGQQQAQQAQQAQRKLSEESSPGRPAKRPRGAQGAASPAAQHQPGPSHLGEAGSEDGGCLYDTVGCVVLAHDGSVAAGVSSGGIVLKTEGRVGEAAVYGAGCWAQQPVPAQRPPQQQQAAQQQGRPAEPPCGAQRDHSAQHERRSQQQLVPAVACSVTGVGEHVMRHLLARECCLAAAAPAAAQPPASPQAAQGAALSAARNASVAGRHAQEGSAAAGAQYRPSPARSGQEDASLEGASSAGANSAEHADLALDEVAAELLRRTVLRGPPPHDCGLLCLRVLPLGPLRPAGADADAAGPRGMADGAALDGVAGSGSGCGDVHAGSGLDGGASAGPRRHAVEVAVVHSAHSMAFGHMAFLPALPGTVDGAAGHGTGAAHTAQRSGSNGETVGARAAEAAPHPTICVLRRQPGAGGLAAPDVQTYVHGTVLLL